MKIWVFALCRNAADILPFWLRHYSEFADRILVWDDYSTDKSFKLLSGNPKVSLGMWPWRTGIDENTFLEFAVANYKMARGEADWVMWVDTDEFIYHPNIVPFLEQSMAYQVIRPRGFNMMCEGLPKDNGKQIWSECRKGVYAPVYSKPVVFQPSVDISWNRGKHALENCNPIVLEDSDLKLLHYRYLGYEYTKRKNAINYARCCGDKGAAWSCAPTWTGEHSPEWAVEAMKVAFDVL